MPLHALARPPWPPLLACAALGLAACVAQMGTSAAAPFCGDAAARLRFALDPVEALDNMTRLNPPGRLAGAWAAMVLAMMPLLLAPPVMHVSRSSLRRRRPRAVAEFALGYGAAWMVAGPPLIAGALLLTLAAGPAAPLAAAGVALAWSASPWHRAAANRAHRLSAIPPFGPAATRGCFGYGLRHGGWCVATCWAWMAAPLAAGHQHLPAMAVAAAAMLAERLTPPGRPRWRAPTPLTAAGGALLRTVRHPD